MKSKIPKSAPNSCSDIEARATQIKLSSINIIEKSGGLTRVARQIKPLVESENHPPKIEVDNGSYQYKKFSFAEERHGGIEKSLSRLGTANYQYKPPASTKYFLWFNQTNQGWNQNWKNNYDKTT
jgi:hypothetical protein